MPQNSAEIRIQKYLSELGLASRREAEAWIAEGRVRVNGQVVELGAKVDPQRDVLKVGNRTIAPNAPRPRDTTLAVNKPKGFICSHHDPHHDRTIFDLLSPDMRKLRLVVAGRLDKDSEGLVILTSDGELAQRLTHPSQQVIKRYRVTIHKPFDTKFTDLFLRGLEVEGDFLRFEKLMVLPTKYKPGQVLEVHLDHGRKREIRRLLKARGYFVDKLERFQIGGLTTRGLGKGAWRELTRRELHLLTAQTPS